MKSLHILSLEVLLGKNTGEVIEYSVARSATSLVCFFAAPIPQCFAASCVSALHMLEQCHILMKILKQEVSQIKYRVARGAA